MSESNITKPRNPFLTVDCLIERPDGNLILIKRKNPPYGFAFPGGFVNYGEHLEEACIREVKEEVSLDVVLTEQFYTYSSPTRDPRSHIVTTVFIGKSSGEPKAADDAKEVICVSPLAAREVYDLAFDHKKILIDYIHYRETGKKHRLDRNL